MFLLSLINELVPLIVGHKLDSVKEDITDLQLLEEKKEKAKANKRKAQRALTSSSFGTLSL